MNIRFRKTSKFWRIVSCLILPKYKADIYNATNDEIVKIKEWLKFQNIKYTSDTSSYYSANSIKKAEKTKPKITINLRNEENLMSIKLAWC